MRVLRPGWELPVNNRDIEMATERNAGEGGDRADYVSSFSEIVEKARRVKEMLDSRGIPLNPASVLAFHIKNAERLSKEWEAGEIVDGWVERQFATLQLNRICDAMLAAEASPDAQECLARIARSDLQLLLHERSEGKDALFELEILDYMRRNGAVALMAEPDLHVVMQFGNYPIACKKINSIKNLEKQLSSACRQLKPFKGEGLIALNLDVLVPEAKYLEKETSVQAQAHLHFMLRRFRGEHMAKIQKVVASAKCDGIIFSITTAANVMQMKPRLHYFNQTDFWTLNNANYHGRVRAKRLAELIENGMKSRRESSTHAQSE